MDELEVPFKMNKSDFSELVAALKGKASKDARFQLAKPGNFDGARDRKVVALGLEKWKIIYMPPRLDDIQPWSLPSPT